MKSRHNFPFSFWMMWHRACLSWRQSIRRCCTVASRRHIEDEGDWAYSSEWWDKDSNGGTLFLATSNHGNGVISIFGHPSSRPSEVHWPETEKWLQRRYEESQPCSGDDSRFRILGYQWRTLHFNDESRQSTVKVMAAYRQSEPRSIYLMQQPHCLAIPYLRSMVTTGLAAMASCGFDIMAAACGKKTMRILCIGHGGGSLPLFLANKIRGAIVDIVEIDPLVICASIHTMGFPAFSVMSSLGQRAASRPNTMDEVLWKGINERLHLYESDAEKFILHTPNLYDMIFIDAYDGDDIFPRKLWDPDSTFLKALSSQLNPRHGTVVLNLHSDSDDDRSADASASVFGEPILPMSKHVSKVCQTYKDVLLRNGNSSGSGVGFTVAAPWVCNTALVVSRGSGIDSKHCSRNSIMGILASKYLEVENVLDFSCLDYIKRDFRLVD